MIKISFASVKNIAVFNRGAFRALAVVFVALAVITGTWGAETVFARSAESWPADWLELAQLAVRSRSSSASGC